MFSGIVGKVNKDVTAFAPSNMKIRVVTPPTRRHSVWIGGSISASLGIFQQIWAVCPYLRDSVVVDLDQFVTKDIIPINEKEVVLPLTQEFPNFYNKEDLALSSELEPFSEKASFMTAIDYIVYEKSDIFMPSHGGNHGL
ncbi:hypothetical protein VitviT2T_026658 [Vitis vinifera]|uniref:O-fucosyltransferase family protein n=1 Tax=Vitis vinifera TaxID=29760 RepID=A0ABY9DMN2_VITVI|nr:hypothetical protein VitviT2T_026658 [Vitis vinifera]